MTQQQESSKNTFLTLEQTSAMKSKNEMPPTIAQLPHLHTEYVLKNLCEHRMTPEQRSLMAEIDELEKPLMAGSQDEADFLAFLCEMLDARRVLEVGVFRGSTTLAIAIALKSMMTLTESDSESKSKDSKCQDRLRKVIGLDINEAWVATGRKYWQKAGVEDLIDIRINSVEDGGAVALMEEMINSNSSTSKNDETGNDNHEGPGCFDLIFVDANKNDYEKYYEKGLILLRRGGILAIDNTLWHGRVLSEEYKEKCADTKAICGLNEKIWRDERVRVSMLEIADGLTLCRKK